MSLVEELMHRGYSKEYAAKMVENGGPVRHRHQYDDQVISSRTIIETCWCGARRETNHMIVSHYGPDGYATGNSFTTSEQLERYNDIMGFDATGNARPSPIKHQTIGKPAKSKHASILHRHKYIAPELQNGAVVETCQCGARRETSQSIVTHYDHLGFATRNAVAKTKDLERYDRAVNGWT